MLVREVMTSPAVTVHPDASVKEAARRLTEHGITAMPVVDALGALVGVVSEADVIRDTVLPDQRAHERPVHVVVRRLRRPGLRRDEPLPAERPHRRRPGRRGRADDRHRGQEPAGGRARGRGGGGQPPRHRRRPGAQRPAHRGARSTSCSARPALEADGRGRRRGRRAGRARASRTSRRWPASWSAPCRAWSGSASAGDPPPRRLGHEPSSSRSDRPAGRHRAERVPAGADPAAGQLGPAQPQVEGARAARPTAGATRPRGCGRARRRR